ncbi:adenosine receptor A2b-like [Oncorhynchus keta]|uniref:adenosine receptor A2b-like n=1 Tax=Oncorhynchus keta TaxID=8018 RepID=UPI0015FDA271|nr:adenosine receptor A2b-like [Oncorhynchus keta]XP_052317361.1 adenosine receptor A2b-like [Oncorhynchus keta]
MLNDAASVIYIVLELLIAVLSVLGNVLVCWAVCLNSNLQSITNFFVVSLAVADIAVGVLGIPFAIVISTGFCSNFYGCLFIACFVLVLTQSSIFSLLAIAIDRYIAIKIPLRYNSLVTGQRAKGIIAVCWVLSIIIGLTPMLGWNKSTERPNSTCPPGLMECLFEDVVVMDYMVYFNFFACVLMPLLLMLVIYLRIFMAARHQLKLIELKAVHGGKSHSTLQKEVQAAKSLAIIVGLFAICWLPLHIINCFTLFCPQCARPPLWIIYVAIMLSHGNSVVNPFIYANRIQEFRHTFKRVIRRHVLFRRDPFDIGGSSHTSTHNSISGSVRVKANGLRFDLFTEYSSSSSSCESSHPCHSHTKPTGGVLKPAPIHNHPLTVISSHNDRESPPVPQPLRQTHTHPLCHPLQHGDQQQQSHKGPEVEEVKNRQDLSPVQVKTLFYKHKTCFTELTEVS